MNKAIYMKKFHLGFVKVCINAERFELMREDCASIFSAIFESCHVASKSSSFPGLINHKILQAS